MSALNANDKDQCTETMEIQMNETTTVQQVLNTPQNEECDCASRPTEQYIDIFTPSRETITTLRGARLYDLILADPDSFREPKVGADLDKTLPILGATYNHELISLSSRLDVNGEIQVIRADSVRGADIYRRSLTFTLAMACDRVFKDRTLVISHSLGHDFYFYFNSKTDPTMDDIVPTEDEVQQIRAEMKKIIEADYPILTKTPINANTALSYFTTKGMHQSYTLLKDINAPRVFVNKCCDFMTLYHQSPLVPRTGFLKVWAIDKYQDGITLRYPSRYEPGVLRENNENEKMYRVFDEYSRWRKILRVPSVGYLNCCVIEKRIKDFMQIAETGMNKTFAEIVARVTPDIKVILIAGPSSSGKTTTAKKLGLNLKAVGRTPVIISMDEYFVNRVDTPLDENGRYDFEHLHAVDLPLFNQHLAALTRGQTIQSPIFDFKSGTRKVGPSFTLPQDGIILVEGIHALNPQVSAQVARKNKMLIFIQPMTQLNIDDVTRISTTENRMIRRMVRDNQFRNLSPEATIMQFPSVRRGEERWIFPYSRIADVIVTTTLDFELGVLSTYAIPLLHTIPPTSPAFTDAQRLLGLLNIFQPINPSLVESNSLLREFIGGSSFKY